MYGQPIPLPQNCVLLHPHWQYHVKHCGVRQSRQCADGSKRSAPILYAIVDSYSTCVNHNPSNNFSLHFRRYLIINCTVVTLVMPKRTHQVHILSQHLSL